MSYHPTQSLFIRLLVLGALLLRVAIPAGYMPASLATHGWYLQWCPDGLPAGLAAALVDQSTQSSSAHHHHHGPGHQDGNGADSNSPSFAKCDFGAISIEAHTALDHGDHGPLSPPLGFLIELSEVVFDGRSPTAAYHPRAPPVHVRPSPLNS